MVYPNFKKFPQDGGCGLPLEISQLFVGGGGGNIAQ